MGQRVLVTGGTGFIAGWCIVTLLRQGYQVRTTIRRPDAEAAVRTAIGSQIDAQDRLSFAIADLTTDAGWDDAVAGCSHVLHVASPLGRGAPRERDALVAPARDGALRVLRAAVAAGVERVVMTSAAATARRRGHDEISTEALWADPADPLLDPYRYSKILAERAAWDFIAADGGATSLTTILPGAVFGPILPGGDPASVWVVRGLLKGQPPRLLDLMLSVVDVRDLAAAHVAALTAPEAPGERFLATGHPLWLAQIAALLKEGLGPKGANIPTRVMPHIVTRIVALLRPQLRMFIPDLGQRREADDSKAEAILGFRSRPPRETLIDCANSLSNAAA